MGYYSFDSFPKDKLSDLENLCLRLEGMRESEGRPPCREWLSEKSKIYLVSYIPHQNLPLLVQSLSGFDYKTPEVEDFLKRVVNLTGRDYFYEGILKSNLKKVSLRH